MKMCIKCKTEKSKSDFGLDKLRPDGLFPYCRACRQLSNSKRVLIPKFNSLGRKHTSSNGYVLRLIAGHPLANTTNCVYEHMMVMYAEHGGGPHNCDLCDAAWSWSSKKSHIDHIDTNKENNSPRNLRFLCQSCNVFRGHSPTSMGKHFYTVDGATMTAGAWARMDAVEVTGLTIARRSSVMGMSDYDAIFSPRRTCQSTQTKKQSVKYDEVRGIVDMSAKYRRKQERAAKRGDR